MVFALSAKGGDIHRVGDFIMFKVGVLTEGGKPTIYVSGVVGVAGNGQDRIAFRIGEGLIKFAVGIRVGGGFKPDPGAGIFHGKHPFVKKLASF